MASAFLRIKPIVVISKMTSTTQFIQFDATIYQYHDYQLSSIAVFVTNTAFEDIFFLKSTPCYAI